MERNRRTKFRRKEFHCSPCGYGTGKQSNFDRHCYSERHCSIIQEGFNESSPTVTNTTGTNSPSLSPVSEAEDETFIFQQLEQERCSDFDDLSTSDSDTGHLEEEVLDNERPENSSKPASTAWSPFESKLHFLLTVLHSSKTHKVSDELLSFIIFILKECGVSNADIPSIAKIKSFYMDELHMEEMIQRNEDATGNIHWMIKPETILKLNIANPEIAKQIHRYPQKSSSTDSSTPQTAAEKWNEMTFPWAETDSGERYVVRDFVQFVHRDQTVVGKIKNFNLAGENKVLHADVEVILYGNHKYFSTLFSDENYECLVKMNTEMSIPLAMCRSVNIDSSMTLYNRVIIGETENFEVMLDETKAGFLRNVGSFETDKPVINLPLNIFIDDLSANKSRRWSPLHAVQTQLSGLPLAEKNKSKNTFFIAASEMVTMTDLLKPVCNDIQSCKEHGIEAFDAMLGREIILTTDVSLLVTDYHMMSLACNHMGPSANKFCPKCLTDKSNPFELGELRTQESTLRTLQKIRIHSQNNAKRNIEKQTGTKLYDNCLWNYLDPHRDTPVGILHFLYLGLAKHLIQLCLRSLSDDQVQLLEIHLSSIDQTGFRYQINGATFFRYIESRQGKDFKHYLQIAPHNMEFVGLRKSYVKALEKLALVSKHIQQSKPGTDEEIKDYLVYVQEKIPELGAKKKTHFCLHISDDVRRHGNMLHYAEDSFEKNHGPIRKCLEHQNGHAKSRDTVVQFMKYELTKHLISGGFLRIGNCWTSANSNVCQYGQEKKIRSFLGITEEVRDECGHLKNGIRTFQRKLVDTSTNLDELNLVMASVAIRTNPENITKISITRVWLQMKMRWRMLEVFYFITTTQRRVLAS
uniref:Uncharacterized protein LOC111115731 n=1 Tax=Crassostrea virginica TaxID=6565 RepID=A0A8B8C3W1_CRAVI|nr:uncharacterized protein LOC111115731 [Crassostrea virginica]